MKEPYGIFQTHKMPCAGGLKPQTDGSSGTMSTLPCRSNHPSGSPGQSRDVLSLCDLHEFCPQNCKHNQMFIVLSLHFGVACHAAKENEKSLRDTSVTQAF